MPITDAAAGAANELVAGGTGFFEFAGRTWEVSPPTDADHATLAGELRRLAKRRQKTPLQQVLADVQGLPKRLQDVAIREAVRAGRKEGPDREPSKEQLAGMLWEPEGASFWLWHLARKHAPGLALDEVRKLVTEANVVEVLGGLAEATKVKKATKADPSTGSPG